VAMSWYSCAWCALLNPFAIASSWKTAHLPSEVTIEQSEKKLFHHQNSMYKLLEYLKAWKNIGWMFWLTMIQDSGRGVFHWA
jgi:hypothetical protein